MTFLSKLGRVMQIVGKVTQAVLGFGPPVVAMTPGTKDDQIMAKLVDPLTQIAALVVQVEAMAQTLEQPLAGPDKLKMVTPIIGQIFLSSALMAGGKIENIDLYRQGCASVGSGIADILNSRKDNIDTKEYS